MRCANTGVDTESSLDAESGDHPLFQSAAFIKKRSTADSRIKATLPLALALLLLGLLGDGRAAGLYRWVDADGNIHYTDTIPPDEVRRARTEFSEGGVPVHRVPRAKTADEIHQAKELEGLREQRKRLIEQLQAADRVLLRTFRTEDDVLMARDGKIAAIDVMILVTQNNIRRQDQWLAGLRAQAANLERSGKPVPDHLKDSIRKTEGSIRDARKTIADREAQKAAIRESFAQDLQRFNQLQDLGTVTEQYSSRTLIPVRHRILTCERADECDRLWGRATGFLRSAEGMEVQSGAAENLLILAPPERKNDVVLVLSRIRDTERASAVVLLLELLCKVSLREHGICLNREASSMIEGFDAAVATEDRDAKAH